MNKKWLLLILILTIPTVSIVMLTRTSAIDPLMSEISQKDPQTIFMLEEMRKSEFSNHTLSEIMISSDIEALYEVAIRSFHSTDPYNAIKTLEAAANMSHVKSMEYLGYIYDTHKSYYDKEKADYWYIMAAENGSIAGAYYLCAHCIDEGSYEEAFSWCLTAADAGIPAAEYTVGYMYASGTGTEKDLENAIKYICSAKDKGRASRQAIERYGIVCND